MKCLVGSQLMKQKITCLHSFHLYRKTIIVLLRIEQVPLKYKGTRPECKVRNFTEVVRAILDENNCFHQNEYLVAVQNFT